LLLRIAQEQVFDFGGVDTGALDDGLDHGHGQVVAADIAKDAFFFMRAADGRANPVNNDCVFHR
jgi:hypothetical protein